MPNDDKKEGLDLLENAYSLSSAADNSNYYNAFASTYDRDFADGLGYVIPRTIAEVFSTLASESDCPVADVGCGTGLVALELGIAKTQIDGLDISREMLDVADAKNLYRSLYEIDLSSDISSLPADYGAVVSAGTFTHGHLGPGVLVELLNIGKSNALFVIGINAKHYQEMSFSKVLEDLSSRNIINSLSLKDSPIYSNENHAHGSDQAHIITFRKHP